MVSFIVNSTQPTMSWKENLSIRDCVHSVTYSLVLGDCFKCWAQSKQASKRACIHFSLLLTVGVMYLAVSSSCHLDFTMVMDHNMELWAEINPFSTKLLLSGYFITAKEMKLQYPTLGAGMWSQNRRNLYPLLTLTLGHTTCSFLCVWGWDWFSVRAAQEWKAAPGPANLSWARSTCLRQAHRSFATPEGNTIFYDEYTSASQQSKQHWERIKAPSHHLPSLALQLQRLCMLSTAYRLFLIGLYNTAETVSEAHYVA